MSEYKTQHTNRNPDITESNLEQENSPEQTSASVFAGPGFGAVGDSARDTAQRVTPGNILSLQKTIGNRAVTRLLEKNQSSYIRPQLSHTVPLISRAFNSGPDLYFKRGDTGFNFDTKPQQSSTATATRSEGGSGTTRTEGDEDEAAATEGEGDWSAPIEDEADTRTELKAGRAEGDEDEAAATEGEGDWSAPIEEEADTRAEGTLENSGRRSEIQRVGAAGTIQRVTFPKYAAIVAAMRSDFDADWEATLAATTKTSRREQGFWVQWNSTSKAYSVTGRAIAPTVDNDTGATINLPNKPADAGDVYTIASFHTHTPTANRAVGRPVGPSGADIGADAADNVAGVVYDYVEAKSGNIPAGHPLRSRAQLYSSRDQRT